jgi:hypothetical protein
MVTHKLTDSEALKIRVEASEISLMTVKEQRSLRVDSISYPLKEPAICVLSGMGVEITMELEAIEKLLERKLEVGDSFVANVEYNDEPNSSQP